MKIHVLEFKVKDHLFGIRTEFIKNIFDIEFLKNAPLLPDYVYGVTVHGKLVLPLICTEKILEIADECSSPIGKTAITVDIKGKLFSLVVDDILKIQEIEKNNNDNEIINFYNLKGKVIEEITPEFLNMKIDIPSFRYRRELSEEKEADQKARKEEVNFLIFKLDDRLFAIKAESIKKVEYLSSLESIPDRSEQWLEGIFLLKDIPIFVGNLKKLLEIGDELGEYLIILENGNKLFSFAVDDIVDITSVEKSDISSRATYSPDSTFKDYFLYNKKVVPVLSEEFINKIIDRYSISTNVDINNNNKTNKLEVDFLIFRICNERFCIRMENIDEVLELKEVHIGNYPTENPLIRGIIATGKESLFLVQYNHIISSDYVPEENEEDKILVLKKGNIKFGLLVTEIEDIVSVPEENIVEFEEKKLFIAGNIKDSSGDLINIINIDWIKESREVQFV
ncbi:chemotaxis protein CheW [Persephonella sp.]